VVTYHAPTSNGHAPAPPAIAHSPPFFVAVKQRLAASARANAIELAFLAVAYPVLIYTSQCVPLLPH
jgi:predicted Zn-dependent peptidase